MEAFTVLDAKAAPLMRQNVNTDIIIPIHRLRDVAQAELGPYAFEPWRYLPDGSENPDFFMHQPAYRGAQIVVADNNFACGSSREGAVWAMMGMGVRCVIAPSFGPIFFNNCFQNGVLPIQLPRAEVLAIAAELEAATRPGSNSEPRLSIDLQSRTVVTPSGRQDRVPGRRHPPRRPAQGPERGGADADARGRDRRPPGQGARQDAVAVSE